LYHYSTQASYLLKKAKYRGLCSALDCFLNYIPWSAWLGLLESVSQLEQPTLVPIPITPSDQKKRGYNQSELMARFLKQSFGLPTKSFLKKTKTNQKQSMLNSVPARQQNVLGVYQLRPEVSIKNQDLIVLDDVITTGATIREAGRVLKQAGARRLIAWSLFGVS